MILQISAGQLTQLMISNDQKLREIILLAMKNSPFLEGVQLLLKDAEKAVEFRQGECKLCGNCCNFSQKGHRLFVSTGELALALSGSRPRQAETLQCCWQEGNICTLRDHRPLGCRIYFCSRESKMDNSDIYETFHRKIRELHDTMKIEYSYFEMTAKTQLFLEE